MQIVIVTLKNIGRLTHFLPRMVPKTRNAQRKTRHATFYDL
jgi:hypothetical protein